jgi:hypothetical protein
MVQPLVASRRPRSGAWAAIFSGGSSGTGRFQTASVTGCATVLRGPRKALWRSYCALARRSTPRVHQASRPPPPWHYDKQPQPARRFGPSMGIIRTKDNVRKRAGLTCRAANFAPPIKKGQWGAASLSIVRLFPQYARVRSGHPGRSGGPRACRWDVLCASRPHSLRGARRSP